MNIKIIYLMLRINETGDVAWYETCACKCRLYACICNNKQRWNNDKCGCKVDVIMDLFGILEYVNVNVMNHVTQDNI